MAPAKKTPAKKSSPVKKKSAKKVASPEYEKFSAGFVEAHPDTAPGSLFGMPCVKLHNKAFMGAYDGGLVVRLSVEDAQVALKIEGATGFDPSGRGKPMKGWVVLPVSARRRWKVLAQTAMDAQA